jgi:hypothetical protein
MCQERRVRLKDHGTPVRLSTEAHNKADLSTKEPVIKNQESPKEQAVEPMKACQKPLQNSSQIIPEIFQEMQRKPGPSILSADGKMFFLLEVRALSGEELKRLFNG